MGYHSGGSADREIEQQLDGSQRNFSLWGELVWSIDKFVTFSRADRRVIAPFQLFTVISHLIWTNQFFCQGTWFSLISRLKYFSIICDYASSLEMDYSRR